MSKCSIQVNFPIVTRFHRFAETIFVFFNSNTGSNWCYCVIKEHFFTTWCSEWTVGGSAEQQVSSGEKSFWFSSIFLLIVSKHCHYTRMQNAMFVCLSNHQPTSQSPWFTVYCKDATRPCSGLCRNTPPEFDNSYLEFEDTLPQVHK